MYHDGRLTQLPDSVTLEKWVFGGAVGHADWINWDWEDYDPTQNQRAFLTTLPDDWTVTLDNDVYLNIWGNRLLRGTLDAVLTTYDSTGTVIDTFNIENDNDYLDQTEIQNLSVGPRGLNLHHPDIIQNGTFQSTSNWTIIDSGGSSAVISGATLNFSDPTFNGESLCWQYSALTVGCSYEVSIDNADNIFTVVGVGDGTNSYNIIPTSSADGTYTTTFTAVDADFQITMAAGSSNPASVTLDNVVVRQLCPVIDCDVASYEIFVQSGTTSSAEESVTRTFNVDCTCYKFQNYPLLFKDRFGSYVPFNFELNNKQKVNVNKKDAYKKFVGNGGATSYTYSANERSKSIYNIDIEEQWTLNTDWLTEAEAAYFEELITTPEASILIDGVYHAVMVTDKSYERLRKNNKKNIQYSINIMFANNNTINV